MQWLAENISSLKHTVDHAEVFRHLASMKTALISTLRTHNEDAHSRSCAGTVSLDSFVHTCKTCFHSRAEERAAQNSAVISAATDPEPAATQPGEACSRGVGPWHRLAVAQVFSVLAKLRAPGQARGDTPAPGVHFCGNLCVCCSCTHPMFFFGMFLRFQDSFCLFWSVAIGLGLGAERFPLHEQMGEGFMS